MNTMRELKAALPSLPIKDLASEFEVESLLGNGGFAHVVRAHDRDGRPWALKLMPVPKELYCPKVDDVDPAAPMLLREARVHLWLSNEPSVLPCAEAFKAVYTDPNSKAQTFMVVLKMPVGAYNAMEWLMGCEGLPPCAQASLGGHGSAPSVWVVWAQMVNAVWRLHCRGVVHKDIKLENFMMDVHGRVQLIDFGLVQLSGEGPVHIAGTPWTMSPAGFKNQDDGAAGDWWSLGIILYQLLQQGAWPFKHCWWPWQKGTGERMEAAIKKAVLSGHVTFKLPVHQQGIPGMEVPAAARQLVLGLLQPDASKRWQLPQVLSSPLLGPALLQDVARRFPDIAQDMNELIAVQRQVMASGPASAVSMAPGSRAVAVASAAAAAALAAGQHLPSMVAHLLPGSGAPHDGYQPLDQSRHAQNLEEFDLLADSPRAMSGNLQQHEPLQHQHTQGGDERALSWDINSQHQGGPDVVPRPTSDHSHPAWLRARRQTGSSLGGSSATGLPHAAAGAGGGLGRVSRGSRTSLHSLFSDALGNRHRITHRPSSLLDEQTAGPVDVLLLPHGRARRASGPVTGTPHAGRALVPHGGGGRSFTHGVDGHVFEENTLFQHGGRPAGHHGEPAAGRPASRAVGHTATKGAEAALTRVVGSFRAVFRSCWRRPATRYDYDRYDSLTAGLTDGM